MKMLQIGDLRPAVPIVQGGMGVGVSLSGLASAVANEGGIGVISAAGLGLLYHKECPDFKEASVYGLKEEIRKVREKTKGIVGVNIMVALTNFTDMVKTAISEKIDIIFSGAGLPMDLPSYLTPEAKTKLVPIVSSARAVKVLCEKWKSRYDYLPDAIVLEGPKAGGHLGYSREHLDDVDYSLERTLPLVLEQTRYFEEQYNVSIPVIAGGGLYNGSDIHRILAMGASGVQMGSIFVPTEECDAAREFKESYINASPEDIVIINSPVGMPGRAISNGFTERVQAGEARPKSCPYHCIKTCDYSKSPYCIMIALYKAFKGDLSRGYAFAGANAYKARKIRSVKETIRTLMEEWNANEMQFAVK